MRHGWRGLAFNFEQFEQLYDLRMVLETTAIDRLVESPFQTLRSHPITETLCLIPARHTGN